MPSCPFPRVFLLLYFAAALAWPIGSGLCQEGSQAQAGQTAAGGERSDGARAVASQAGTARGSGSLAEMPPPLTHYKGREIAKTMHFSGAGWLVRDEREREENASKLLRVLRVRPGQTVSDLGCGNGFYTLPLARLVGPRGRVLAVDIQPEMLHLLSERAKDQGLKNVELIQGTLTDPRLPEGELDLVLLVDVYHEFSHPEHMLQAIRRSLKPHGRMVLVEFRGEDPSVPILPLHKMTKEQIRREILPNGFRLVRQYDGLPWQHVMFFERTELDQEAAE